MIAHWVAGFAPAPRHVQNAFAVVSQPVEIRVTFFGIFVNARAARIPAEILPRRAGGIIIRQTYVAIAAAADSATELQRAIETQESYWPYRLRQALKLR